MFKRSVVFTYGVACYVLFLATFLYAIGFVVDVYVPRSIDAPAAGDFTTSLLIDLALLSCFALQHSVMARPGFKYWPDEMASGRRRAQHVRACVEPGADRAVRLLAPAGRGCVDDQGSDPGHRALCALGAFGWLLVLVATFLINHFDLFGLRQVWLYLIGVPYRPLAFKTPGPYRLVRHPLYVGWLFAFWATPTMTAAHLLFAGVTTLYILVAIRFEERDLVDSLGDAYSDYQRRVPMLVPFARGKGQDGVVHAPIHMNNRIR